MNPLYEQFPTSVLVNGREYGIVTDFREWIKFCELIETSEVAERDKALLMLRWYEDDVPDDREKAILALGEFLGAYGLYDQKHLRKGKTGNGKRAVSFSQDAGDIFSAFFIYYNMDLSSIKYMHWWMFRTLFDSLPFESEIKQKMYYRTLDPNTINNREERKRVVDIQMQIQLEEIKGGYVDDYEIGDVFA